MFKKGKGALFFYCQVQWLILQGLILQFVCIYKLFCYSFPKILKFLNGYLIWIFFQKPFSVSSAFSYIVTNSKDHRAEKKFQLKFMLYRSKSTDQMTYLQLQSGRLKTRIPIIILNVFVALKDKKKSRKQTWFWSYSFGFSVSILC